MVVAHRISCLDRIKLYQKDDYPKKKFGDLGVSELKRLKMLEDENAKLKRIVADLTLDRQILQEVVRKKL